MSFPRYPKYKDSGVEWLGEVPEHWRVAPLKHVVRLRSGGTPSKDNQSYWHGEVPWASSKDLKEDSLADTEDHITRQAVEDGAAELIAPGSVLVVVRGMILSHTFPVTKALVPMAINQDLKALTPRGGLHADFLAWLLRGSSGETLNRIDEAGHGTKVLRLDTWTAMQMAIPPASEQINIATFLARETSRIDGLIAEQQQLIDRLHEKRQATISHAVTNGLNRDAPMKSSGIEWLGDVPAHWELTKIKFLTKSMEQGWSPQCEGSPVADDAEWGILKVGCVNEGIFDPSENKALPSHEVPIPSLAIVSDDVLISRANTRQLVGSAAVATRDYLNLIEQAPLS
jgi:type I restriction enzyme S subunit